MKKMTKQLFVAAMALAAFTACSDSSLTEVGPGNGEAVFGDQAMNSFVLTNANGQQISNVSSENGTYYLNIKTDGLWYIETADNMEFTPTKMYGKGSARVPVLIGNNWAEARNLSYKVNFLNENGSVRRAGETSQTVTQDALLTLERFKKIINSNVFVGYGFMRTKNPIAELCTGIQIFNMEAINEVDTLVKHDFVPETKEEYYYHTCDSMMDKVHIPNGGDGTCFRLIYDRMLLPMAMLPCRMDSTLSPMKDSAVNIWDGADIDEFPDSGKQNRFYNKWDDAQKAVGEKQARKAPLVLKILVLAPLIISFVWKVALLFDSNWDYRWNLADLHVFIKLLIFYGVCFTITAGLAMSIIGTVMACKRNNTPFSVLGFISTFDSVIPIIYFFLAAFFGGVP